MPPPSPPPNRIIMLHLRVSAHGKRGLRFVEDPAASLDRFDAQPACEVHDMADRAGPQFSNEFLYPSEQSAISSRGARSRSDSELRQLRASTALARDARLWTINRPPAAAATRLGLAHQSRCVLLS